jgi:hypothetical protein
LGGTAQLARDLTKRLEGKERSEKKAPAGRGSTGANLLLYFQGEKHENETVGGMWEYLKSD